MCNPRQAMLNTCKRRAEESSNNAEDSQLMNLRPANNAIAEEDFRQGTGEGMVKDRPRPPLRVSIRCNSCSGAIQYTSSDKGRPMAHHIPRPIQIKAGHRSADIRCRANPFSVRCWSAVEITGCAGASVANPGIHTCSTAQRPG